MNAQPDENVCSTVNHRTSGAIAIVIGVFTATVPSCLLFQAVTYLFAIPLATGVICTILGWKARRSPHPLAAWTGMIALLLCVASIAGPHGLLFHDRQSGHPIAFVIPTGYRGPIRLITDPVNGDDVPLTDGVFTYRTGKSGVLRIRDDSPFRRWHSTRVSYDNGNSIPVDHDGNSQPNKVFFHSLGSGVDYTDFFVGTAAECSKHVDRR